MNSLFPDYSPTPESRPSRPKGTQERQRPLLACLRWRFDHVALFDVDDPQQAAKTTTEDTPPRRPTLTVEDLAALHTLDNSTLAEIAGGTLDLLFAMPALPDNTTDPPGEQRDRVGFAIRGRGVCTEMLDGRPRREMVACRQLLMRWAAYQPLIDAIECATVSDEADDAPTTTRSGDPNHE